MAIIYQKTLKQLLPYPFLIIGEIHGIKENIRIIKELIAYFSRENQNICLAMEWPDELEKELIYFLKNGGKLKWRRWQFSRSLDGRISKEHLNFLGWLKKRKNIELICLDPKLKPSKNWRRDWNRRDGKMAEKILRTSKKGGGCRFIIWLGNLHASKKIMKKDNLKPLGCLLSKKIPSKTVNIKILYKSGYYFNLTKKPIKKQQKKQGFDYFISVEKARPITPLDR